MPMLKIKLPATTAIVAVFVSTVSGADYSIELIDSPPEPGRISDDFAKELASTGVRVKRGSRRTACEIWFCKEWAVDATFEPTQERLYPFTPGQLIGVLHFSRRGSDFRDQTVRRGWYTLRFGLQPVDGNHEGTSPTRDFLVLVDVGEDEPNKEWDVKELQKKSAEAAGSSHPAMLCLQKTSAGTEPTIRHDEGNDRWILHVSGQGSAGESTMDVPVDLIVAGHAAE